MLLTRRWKYKSLFLGCLLLLLTTLDSLQASQIADCCCDTETIDGHNNKFVNKLLTNLRERNFFRIFQVALYKDCQFWPDNSLCYKPTCSVAQCCDEEIPQPWKEEKLEKVDTEIFNIYDTWINEDEDQWVAKDSADSAVYVDLARNPDGYTGYKGAEAGRVWKAIYEAKHLTFSKMNGNGNGNNRETKDMDMEERVLYRLISGFHTLTSAMVFSNYPIDENSEITKFGPNIELYEKFLHPNEEYINNLYFDFVFLLRAVNKASDIIKQYDYNTGNEKDDSVTKQLITQFIETDFIQQQCSVTNSFDESALFKENKQWLMDDCRRVFRNISEILDCVGCDKCKLHAKLEFLGLGTALKILFTKDQLTTDFIERNELIALIVTLGKYSDAVRFINEMEALIAERDSSNKNNDNDNTSISKGSTNDDDRMTSNAEILTEFISFVRDFNRVTNMNEWKQMIDKMMDVNDVNDFLDYPRNVIVTLVVSFLVTFVVLLNQLCMYCPDTHSHHENGDADDNSAASLSNTSLHAGEQSVKHSPNRRKKRKKKT